MLTISRHPDLAVATQSDHKMKPGGKCRTTSHGESRGELTPKDHKYLISILFPQPMAVQTVPALEITGSSWQIWRQMAMQNSWQAREMFARANTLLRASGFMAPYHLPEATRREAHSKIMSRLTRNLHKFSSVCFRSPLRDPHYAILIKVSTFCFSIDWTVSNNSFDNMKWEVLDTVHPLGDFTSKSRTNKGK